MLDLFYQIIDVESQVFYLILLVSVVATFLQREIVGADTFTYIALPTFIFASLVSLYVCRTNYWLIFGDKNVEIIAASFVGVTASFISFLVFLSISSAITGWHVKRVLRQRNLDIRVKQGSQNIR